eukprot:752313-Hanusia_phi.AAC.1
MEDEDISRRRHWAELFAGVDVPGEVAADSWRRLTGQVRGRGREGKSELYEERKARRKEELGEKDEEGGWREEEEGG